MKKPDARMIARAKELGGKSSDELRELALSKDPAAFDVLCKYMRTMSSYVIGVSEEKDE